MTTERRTCPDGGTCHHECRGPCQRTMTCFPLSGTFPGDKWPSIMLTIRLTKSRLAGDDAAVGWQPVSGRVERGGIVLWSEVLRFERLMRGPDGNGTWLDDQINAFRQTNLTERFVTWWSDSDELDRMRVEWIPTDYSRRGAPLDAALEVTLHLFVANGDRRQLARVIRESHDCYRWFGVGTIGGRGDAETMEAAQTAATESLRAFLRTTLATLEVHSG